MMEMLVYDYVIKNKKQITFMTIRYFESVNTPLFEEKMRQAVALDWVDLMLYTTWGCIDCISFTTGEMKKRYGFIYVDKENDGTGTLERSKKASFEWYKKVIETNGESIK